MQRGFTKKNSHLDTQTEKAAPSQRASGWLIGIVNIHYKDLDQFIKKEARLDETRVYTPLQITKRWGSY